METESKPQSLSLSPPKNRITFDEAVQNLQIMFPGVDKDVIVALLEANDNKMQRTIDSLLVISGEYKPEILPLPTQSEETQFSSSVTSTTQQGGSEDVKTTTSVANYQLADDEIFARTLQAQMSSGDGNPDDELIAREMARMEKDEMFARKLQQQEERSAEAMAAAMYRGYPVRRRSGPFTWPENSDTETDEESGEPISTQVDKKLSEIGQDIKSGWSSFTSKLSQVFTSTDPTSTSPPPAPTVEDATYSPLYEKDQEENDLLSDDDDDDNNHSLIDMRKERKTGNVELTINTE